MTSMQMMSKVNTLGMERPDDDQNFKGGTLNDGKQ